MTEHHYTECGLQNVVIRGLRIEVDDDGDEIVSIPAINELHQVIALGIVSHPKGMSGSELRFLRTEMGLTQAELAALVHRDKQSIGRWERGEIEIDSAAEVVIRLLAMEKLKLNSQLSVEEVSRKSVPTAETQTIEIHANDGGYQLAAA
jgi:DNA-binding transcriptional regulator YiaG